MPDLIKRLWRTPQGKIGLCMVALIGLVAVLGPWLAPHSPEQFNFGARLRGPGPGFWLGTDQFGRDILSRIMYGAAPTLGMALAATLIGTLLGAFVGTASSYLGGRADEVIMRLVDAVMAIPHLLFALLIVTALGAGGVNALLAIGIAFAPGMARLARSTALTVRRHDYVNAAIARGESPLYIVVHEMMPNVIAPIVVESTIRVAFAVMLVATLSFLGLGAQPPSPEWGLMIANARDQMFLNPWIIIWPGVAIAMTAVGFNLLGDGLRDALNPKTHT